LLADQRSRDAIEVAERFADGRATAEEVRAAEREAKQAARAAERGARAEERAAANTAWDAALAAQAEWAVEATEWAAEAAEWGEDVFGNTQHHLLLDCILPPRIQAHFPAHVKGLATTIYDNREWSLLPILADALEEIGQAEMAAHCRCPIHAKGCHVLDSILGLG